MTTLDHPLLLSSILVPKPWGGDRLRSMRAADGVCGPIGESWDVADLPTEATPVTDPVSRVLDGPLAGRSLHELLQRHPEELLGASSPSAEGRFPLLVKLLDAAETLSLQVHPPRSLAPTRAKTETWVVLDAAKGAELLLGVRPGVTLDDVAATIGTPALLELVATVPARAGDVVHVPAGTIHALGAGVLVAEVQTPSDVTHRLWDWPDERDGGRELHLESGLASIEAGWGHNTGVTVSPAIDGRLVTTDDYVLDRVTLRPDAAVRPSEAEAARVVIVLEGTLVWDDADGPRVCRRGETVVLPATLRRPLAAGPAGTTLLMATPR